MPHLLEADMRACIAACSGCHATCVETAAHCLAMGGEHAGPRHQAALLDCAQACALGADVMLRGSDLHPRTCGLCAEACDRCAAECERLANGDATMLACARTCRECAESCRRMAAAA